MLLLFSMQRRLFLCKSTSTRKKEIYSSVSVSDPHSLSADPDSAFLPNADPDPNQSFKKAIFFKREIPVPYDLIFSSN
jgi:hypothetical protein